MSMQYSLMSPAHVKGFPIGVGFPSNTEYQQRLMLRQRTNSMPEVDYLSQYRDRVELNQQRIA